MRARLLPLALIASVCFSALPIVSAMAAVQTTAPVFSNAAVTGSAVVAEAERFLGYPYSYTGDSPATGFSCIGFVWYVYHELGMNIPGSNPAAYQAYQQVSESNLQPGDLVFFQGTDPGLFPSHVAIYIGGGKVIAADNPSYGVTISSLVNDPRDGNYWQDHYLSAERPWSGSSTSTGGTPSPLPHPHHVLIVTVSSLNLRSGPSMAYSVLTVLTRGTRVRVEGWAPAWVRVATAGGTVGWVLRAGVSRDGGFRPRLGRHQYHHRLSAATRHYIWASAKTVYVYSLRVHSAPSLSAPVVLNLVAGNRVGIEARDGAWDKILTARGLSGWLLAQYLGHHRMGAGSTRGIHRAIGRRAFHHALRAGINIRSFPSMQASVLTVSDGNPVRILQWASAWAKVQLSNGTVGWVSRIFLGAAIRNSRATGQARLHHLRRSPGIAGGRAVLAGVRIHTGPSLNYTVESFTTVGMRIRVLGYEAGFAHIETSSGIDGWIEAADIGGRAGRSVRRAVTHIAQTRKTGAYATASVRLHATPDISGAVVGVVYAGARLSILRSGLFDYVRLSTGQTGWVDAAYIAG